MNWDGICTWEELISDQEAEQFNFEQEDDG